MGQAGDQIMGISGTSESPCCSARKKVCSCNTIFSPHNPVVAPDLQVSILGMTLLFLEWIDSFLVDRPGCIMIHEDC